MTLTTKRKVYCKHFLKIGEIILKCDKEVKHKGRHIIEF